MTVNLTNTKSNRFLQIKNYYLDTFNATNSKPIWNITSKLPLITWKRLIKIIKSAMREEPTNDENEKLVGGFCRI